MGFWTLLFWKIEWLLEMDFSVHGWLTGRLVTGPFLLSDSGPERPHMPGSPPHKGRVTSWGMDLCPSLPPVNLQETAADHSQALTLC